MCQMILILRRQIRSKRQRRLCQVMDEFSVTQGEEGPQQPAAAAAAAVPAADNDRPNNTNNNNGANQRNHSKALWKLMKVPVTVLGTLFCLSEHYASDYFDSMGTGDALRDARLRVWLRQDPSLADRHYMMVQSGMRYSFFLY